jgi:vacuolar iron transporter family protein
VGGGGVSAHAVILTGIAALVAGAFSMGTGEYISVTNQNELVHAEVSLERVMPPAPGAGTVSGPISP